MLTIFWEEKRTISIDFLDKSLNVNDASYSQLLGKIHIIYWMNLVDWKESYFEKWIYENIDINGMSTRQRLSKTLQVSLV